MRRKLSPEMMEDENPEWTSETTARAVRFSGLPASLQSTLASRKPGRGPGGKPAKAVTTLRLPAETLARWKATGRGWQTRMAEVLKKAL